MSVTQVAAHVQQGQAPPNLAADLVLIAGLSTEHLAAFCSVARELLRAPEDTATFRKAARQLGVEADVVESAVRALCYVMISAVIAGRPAEDLLSGIAVEMPAAVVETLITFYKEEADGLERELSSGLALPHYRGLDWRLQVQLGGRYTARKAPQASFLLRLHTSSGSEGSTEHLMQADLPNMRRLASELECALREDKSSHSRRIARRL